MSKKNTEANICVWRICKQLFGAQSYQANAIFSGADQDLNCSETWKKAGGQQILDAPDSWLDWMCHLTSDCAQINRTNFTDVKWMPISFASFDWVVSPPGDQPQVSSLMSTLTFGLTSWIYLWLQSMSNINWSAPYLRIWSWKWPRRRFHRCWRKWRPPC